MECPYCGAELICDDYYGTGTQEHFYGTAANGIYYPSTFKKLGDIYKCPNTDGFEDSDECCESAVFNGYFYTDERENLYEGYPC